MKWKIPHNLCCGPWSLHFLTVTPWQCKCGTVCIWWIARQYFMWLSIMLKSNNRLTFKSIPVHHGEINLSVGFLYEELQIQFTTVLFWTFYHLSQIIVYFEMQKPQHTSAQSHSRHAGFVDTDINLRKYLVVSVLLIPNKNFSYKIGKLLVLELPSAETLWRICLLSLLRER